MDADWRSRVKELFQAARERRPEERVGYLDEACGEDAELRREIESLLIEHDRHSAEDEALPDSPPASPRPADDPLIGGTLGRYRVVGLVGKGGMGTVYEAEDPELRRTVALKVLPPAVARDPKRLERFKREARSVAALSHPNVVTLHSVEEEDDTHFLTMELVGGEPLDKLIPERGLDLREILDRASQLAEGLRAAHEQGIVHRDLKPANVIVDTEGRLRILDFGLAKAQPARPETSQAETSLALTVQGTVLGTAPYMSPEQVEGKPLDARSDIFSLGSILYEMATGRWPFPGETLGKVMGAILHEEPASLTELRSDLPEGLERIVNRCLAKEPAQRYQSARELRDALEELKQAPATARRPAAGKWAAVVAALGVLVLVGVLSLKPGTEEPSRAEAPAAAELVGKMIAVLPFENLGPPEYEYFAAGMTEEISARLEALSELRVIANASARQYAQSDKTARQIGEELGAAYLVMGSVRFSGEAAGDTKIRVTPRIISTDDDTQLWADTFDRVFVDVFEIQTGIANAVVELLDVTVREPERQILENRPTESFEAYQAYLKSQERVRQRVSEETLGHAVEELEHAVELDPGFVEAWRQLVTAHARFYSFRFDQTDERRRLASEALSRIEALAPGSATAHLARGIFAYHVERDYDTALDEFLAAERLPGGLTSVDWTAALLQRTGRWDEAAAEWRRSTVLDPRSDYRWNRLGEVYSYLGEFDEAIRSFHRAIALNPSVVEPQVNKAMVYWLRDGSLEDARNAFDGAPDVPLASSTKSLLFWQQIFEGDYAGALEYLAELPDAVLGMPIYFRPKALYEGVAHSLLGDEEAARSAFALAAEELEAELESTPDNEKLHSALGVAYAGLGRKEDAVREGQRAVALVPLKRDPWFGLPHGEDLAWIYTLVDDHERALAELETLLSMPSLVTIPRLEIDPRWAPLRDHPKYRELKERFGGLGSSAERTADRGRVDTLTG